VASQEHEFFERIATADSFSGLDEACTLTEVLDRKVLESKAFGRHLAGSLHAHLVRVSDHPAFVHWLDCYLGFKQTRFQSPLQQPNYLYYPSLPPKAWFTTGDVPGLHELRANLADVQHELRSHLESASGFTPYVSPDAGQQAKWRDLAGQEAWSAIHLVRRNIWDEERLSQLPFTSRFLRAAPLAQCPPHAPECFVSRLLPGTVLPPHFGLSNIKLTAHLPVELPPEGCSITVAGISKTWSEDDFLIFDDSFLHSASNLAAISRTVLIFDIWHPDLSSSERTGLAYSIRALDRVNTAIGRAAKT
jgi:hypothetical protein